MGEYKKLHCRLELLATEYEMVCRLETAGLAGGLGGAGGGGPVFLPLLADVESSRQAAAADVPERAVQWALDFSQLVGTASQGLEGLVRELEQRRRQLRSLAGEL